MTPARGSRRRIGWPLLIVVAAWAVAPLAGSPATAEASARKLHRSQPARTGQAAPDRTGSIGTAAAPVSRGSEAAPAASLPPALAAVDDGPLIPVTLPNVPRSRMIACGEDWQAMKMKGTTGDESWRDYALKCLVDKNRPPR